MREHPPIIKMFFEKKISKAEQLRTLLSASSNWKLDLSTIPPTKPVVQLTEKTKNWRDALNKTPKEHFDFYSDETFGYYAGHLDEEQGDLDFNRLCFYPVAQFEIFRFESKNCSLHQPKFLGFVKHLIDSNIAGLTIDGPEESEVLAFFGFGIFEFRQNIWAFAGSPPIENFVRQQREDYTEGYAVNEWFAGNDENFIKEHLTENELRKNIRANCFKTFENKRGGICVMRYDYCDRDPDTWSYINWFSPRFEIRKKLRLDGLKLGIGAVELEVLIALCGLDPSAKNVLSPKIVSKESLDQIEKHKIDKTVFRDGYNVVVSHSHPDPLTVIKELSFEETKSLGFDDPKNREYAIKEVEKWTKQ